MRWGGIRMMNKYFNVDNADQDLTFIIQKSGYGRYVEDLEKRIRLCTELEYYLLFED